MGCVYLDVNVNIDMNATTTLESIAKTVKGLSDANKDKTDAEIVQLWKANLLPHMIVCDRMAAGKFLDPSKVEKRWFRELLSVSKHRTHELVKDAGARGGPQVHAQWLRTNTGNVVRNGLGKTPLTVSVKHSVVRSTPPLTVSTLPMTIASPYIDGHTLSGRCQSDRGMDGARAMLRAWNGLVKHKWPRDGATTWKWCRRRPSTLTVMSSRDMMTISLQQVPSKA